MSRKPHILYVEDDHALLVAMGHSLLDAGYEVALARNGHLALELLQKGFPAEAILLDLGMPLMSGAQLIAALAAGPFAQIPVVALSATLVASDGVPGAQVTLRKPALLSEILDAVHSVLR